MGLTKSSLVKSKSGKVVGKARSALAKKRFAGSALAKWAAAVKRARKELKITGFVPIGGKTAQGKALLAKVKSFLAWSDHFRNCSRDLATGACTGHAQPCG